MSDYSYVKKTAPKKKVVKKPLPVFSPEPFPEPDEPLPVPPTEKPLPSEPPLPSAQPVLPVDAPTPAPKVPPKQEPLPEEPVKKTRMVENLRGGLNNG